MPEHKFELNQGRKQIIRFVKNLADEKESKEELLRSKFDLKRSARRVVKPHVSDPHGVANVLGTNFENGVELADEIVVVNRTFGDVETGENCIHDHEIDGRKTHTFITDSSAYRGYTVDGTVICSCPSQKYQLLCKHKIAALIAEHGDIT